MTTQQNKKYECTVTKTYTVTIEAEDEDDALNKAYDTITEDMVFEFKEIEEVKRVE